MAVEPSTVPGQSDLENINHEGMTAGEDAAPDAIDIDQAAEKFAAAISEVLGGEVLPVADGEIQRFDDPEKNRANKNCWVYFDPSGVYGVYGNWATDERYEWHLDDFEAISDEELARIHEQVEVARQQREQRRANRHDRAWRAALPAGPFGCATWRL